ncbi:hypothetical protein DQ384_27635 [Sphaerisporangium album]|uniref:Lipoprotein n=1 Tax=Sphaerisporangium album TaxID=509200 RepID=A0A367F9U6_9ACTN|nr:hypothetical protein [Sphaerisporangium album]RCG27041.1 hypothetical protein DQ384_27635 [Sphaerisporangium album]
MRGRIGEARRRARERYGAGLWHLFALLACFLVAAYALTRVIAAGILLGFLLWFLGAVILHDFVVLPLYSAGDRALQRLPPVADRRRGPSVNYLRVPAGLSGLLLLIWFPLVLRASEHNYREATALSTAPFLGRWLLVTLVLFAGSALVYAVRRAAGGRRTGKAHR